MTTTINQRVYRIGELAAATQLTPDALRYYERLGLLPKPPRSPGGLCQVNIARTGFASDEIATRTLDLDTRRLTPDPEGTFA